MDQALFIDSNVFTWVILPALIFIARVVDVSMGTMRVIYVSRGMKLMAALLGFFEVLIWLVAIGQIMQNLNNVFCYLAYGGGFATGNIVGVLIEEKLSIGTVVLRVITKKEASELTSFLRSRNYGVTTVDAEGGHGPVKVLFIILRRHDLQDVICMVKRFNPNAFYTVEDLRLVSRDIASHKVPLIDLNNFKIFRPHRKGK